MNCKRKEDLTNGRQPSQVLKRRSESNISHMPMKVKPVFPQRLNSGRNQKFFSLCGMTVSSGTGTSLPELRKGGEE